MIARVDLAYPDARLAIEVDGHAFHSSRRDWQRDRHRQNALIRLGWRVYRVTWEDATRRPRQVVSDVAALLGDR
jgi:very-short-patch-repair endonuclease